MLESSETELEPVYKMDHVLGTLGCLFSCTSIFFFVTSSAFCLRRFSESGSSSGSTPSVRRPSATLYGCQVCVICNSKCFHSFVFKLCLMIVHILKMCIFYLCTFHFFLIFDGFELRHFSIKIAEGCLVCVIWNSNSIHFFIFKHCIMIVHTLMMCTTYYVHVSYFFHFFDRCWT